MCSAEPMDICDYKSGLVIFDMLSLGTHWGSTFIWVTAQLLSFTRFLIGVYGIIVDG